LEVFVYGRVGLQRHANRTRFPGRQTLEASQAVARLHGARHVVFVEQNPLAIDAGAFHNDVVCVTNERLMLFHEQAFDDVASTKDVIRRAAETSGFEPIFVMASAAQMPIGDAIRSYLFNSQLITRPDGKMSLIVPSDAEDVDSAREFAAACVAGENPIDEVVYRDIRESMRNGGGPACLRLRVPLTDAELSAVAPGCLWAPERHVALEAWVRRHYREELAPEELGDPLLLRESRAALDELTRILGIGSVYEFQR
jgi:succinylarginine dihydrolase